MRPASIVRFELVVLLTILIGLVTIALSWEAAFAPVRRLGYGEGFFIAVQAVSIAVVLLLLWLIGRKGSAIAKWIYVVLFGISIALAAIGIQDTLRNPPAILVLQLVQWALVVYSIWLLFRPDTRDWFGSRGDTAAA
jgi:chromate transport protein ChrA